MQVTLKLQPGLPSLRSPALKACVEQAIDAGHERFGMRLLRHTLEKDGLSLVVTAPNRRALSRGIQGISVRIARAVNRKLERKGRLFADRYDAQSVSAAARGNGAHVSSRAAPASSRAASAKVRAPVSKSSARSRAVSVSIPVRKSPSSTQPRAPGRKKTRAKPSRALSAQA